MTTSPRPDRRSVLGAGIAAMALPVLPVSPSWAASVGAASACSAEFRSLCGLADRFFSSPRSASEIGRAYLATAGEEASPDALAAKILEGRPELAEAVAQGRHADFAAALRAAARADRERGDLVVLDGWLLPVTEARLCAVAALAA